MFVQPFIGVGLVTTAATGRTACPVVCTRGASGFAKSDPGTTLGSCAAAWSEAASDTSPEISFTRTRKTDWRDQAELFTPAAC